MPLNTVATGDNELPISDLGPLAWVLDELRKSLDGATKALRRYVRDEQLARGSVLSEPDTSALRIARQQLHQAVGALEMVGLEAPARVAFAMESVAERLVQRPEQCTEELANRMEWAGFALAEYLEGVLKGKTASPVALFPQYKPLLELVGAQRIHPADLWPLPWEWRTVPLPADAMPRAMDADTRRDMDHAVLRWMKHGEAQAARELCELCTGLAAQAPSEQAQTFGMVCAAYFEGAALNLVEADVYTKRVASRVLQQYAAMTKEPNDVSARLAQDIVFFCSRAVPVENSVAPILVAVRQAYGLTRSKPVDYAREQFGRFDPALLVLARKRIATASETWSALAGGEVQRLRVVADQFSAVADTVTKLHAESGALAQALSEAVAFTVQSAAAPSPAVAMEVATSVLYLEAAYEDLDPTDNQMAVRSGRLAQRLQHVISGGEAEPLEGWMEDLYRRVSERQTMGSVVDELRVTLEEVEKSLDQFFRDPTDTGYLREIPGQLAQMRGVFSVLGLEQPAIAALRMRSSVEHLLVDGAKSSLDRTQLFERLGNSVGAMGFLIDMLSYQRALAKTLFVYDEAAAEFKPRMGRERANLLRDTPTDAPDEGDADALRAVPDGRAPEPALSLPTDIAVTDDDDDTALLDIFLQEAREVLQQGEDALLALRRDPSNLADQTSLRRAFHTLKGSSRMVGLTAFGEAAWAYEQLMNTALAAQAPVSDALIASCAEALPALAQWLDDIAEADAAAWAPAPFRTSADALRLHGHTLPLQVPVRRKRHDPWTLESAAVVAVSASTEASELLRAQDPPAVEFAATQLAGDALLDSLVPHDLGPATTLLADPLADSVGHADFEATQMFEFEPTAPADLRALGLDPAGASIPVAEVQELGTFDFEDLLGLAATEFQALDPLEPSAAVSAPELSVPEPEIQPVEPPLVPWPEPEAGEELQADDEGMKVVGTLRMSIPLYNVYLNEADEWSRRLQTELSEWAMELAHPISDSVISLAHSLLGSSATVGFAALSDLARELEQALQHAQLHRQMRPEHADTFCDAAEEVRRLLHQFAAGFVKEADEHVINALKAITESEFPPSVLGLLEPVNKLLQEPAEVPDVATGADALVAAAAPLRVVDEHDEEIQAEDQLDPDLLGIFEEEATELLPQLGLALRQWVARPDNQSARSEVLRVLHTLKGSARLAGAMRLGEMSHRIESAIEQLGSENLQSIQIEPLLGRFDTLQATFAALEKVPAGVEALPLNNEAHDSPAAEPAPHATAQEAGDRNGVDKAIGLPPAATPAMPPPASVPVPAPVLSGQRIGGAQTVRVRAQLLDRLVNQAGEVMISRARMDDRLTQLRGSLGELTGNLDRLRQQLRDVELQAESQMQSRLALAKDSAQAFDPLEFDRFTRVQELTRMMAESVNDVATVQRTLQRAVEGTEDDLAAQGRQAKELQKDLLRTRMVEFDGVADRLYGVVRQAAKETAKQVKLDVQGGAIEVDRGVLERMVPAFEHMLRNAVVHGIELPDARVARAKPAYGTITVAVAHEGNDITVRFSDDGAGLQFDRIRAKALAKGMIPADTALSNVEAANLIFAPGFSTSDEITEMAGRGIGMDVVRAEVHGMGGLIEVQSQADVGTTFKLVLPLTTAVTQVVVLRMGNITYGVPANLLETVLRLPVTAVDAAYVQQSLPWDGQDIPFYWGGALVQGSLRSEETGGKTRPVAIVRSAGQRLALHVDEVLGNREVVVKNLGPQLARLPGLAGMSVLASGAVVLIYNPIALATVYAQHIRTWEAAQALAVRRNPHAAGTQSDMLPAGGESASQLPLIMVVDDSITVRRVTQRLLKREGYRVVLAHDGLQALEKLKEETPAVVLTDIEMPRMDGFDLTRVIRADPQLAAVPIIVITSRIAEKHRDMARSLGVNHYLGKPYSEEHLLSLVRSYCADAPAEDAVTA